MIRVILQGRTGNNLFQYAAGRCLAIRHNTELTLDVSWANAERSQIMELARLPIQAKFVRNWSPLKRAVRRFSGLGHEAWHRGPIYQDPGPQHGFQPAAIHQPDGSLLVGFFQNEAYFKTIESTIRRELSLESIELPASSAPTLDLIQNRCMVSLHVRRGDYVQIPGTHCIPDDYHANACRHLQERFSGLEFLVFSDDISWCRNHFTGNEFHFCDYPEMANDPFHDLKLMASCDHHIIANSSYSWWGAWLNPSTHKMVIAPQYWMKELPSTSLLPPGWLQLPKEAYEH